MKDIAQRVGISIGTVDRALNGKPGVSADTCARVLAAAQDLGYRPNLAARYLRSRKPVRICVHLPAQASLFWDTLCEGIREAAAPFTPSLAVEFRRSDDDGPRPAPAAAGEADAIIVASRHQTSLARRVAAAARHDVPIACVGSDAPDSARILSVSANPYSVGALAGELIGRFLPGGGEVAVVADQEATPAHADQLRGFTASLSLVSPRRRPPAVVHAHADERETRRRVREMLRAHPRLKGLYVSADDPLPALRAAEREQRLAGLAIVVTELRPEIVDWIRAGTVAAAVYQRPLTQGQLVLQSLYQYLLTGELPATRARVIAPYAVMRSNLSLVLDRLPVAPAPSARTGARRPRPPQVAAASATP